MACGLDAPKLPRRADSVRFVSGSSAIKISDSFQWTIALEPLANGVATFVAGDMEKDPRFANLDFVTGPPYFRVSLKGISPRVNCRETARASSAGARTRNPSVHRALEFGRVGGC